METIDFIGLSQCETHTAFMESGSMTCCSAYIVGRFKQAPSFTKRLYNLALSRESAPPLFSSPQTLTHICPASLLPHLIPLHTYHRLHQQLHYHRKQQQHIYQSR